MTTTMTETMTEIMTATTIHRGSPSDQRRDRRQATLTEIVTTADPEAANRRITAAHHELSGLLDEVLGADAGANFHTWAVWGSREAGRTIGRRDVIGLTPAMAAAGAAVGALLGWWAGVSPLLIAFLLAVPAAGTTHLLLERARRHISHGNRIVLEEIGAVTIDFVAATDARRAGDVDAVDRFLASLAVGPTDDGGQDLLRRAFTSYATAIDETDRTRRHQLVFAANCLAVRHEHLRLQHDISRSMPFGLRRLITRHLLDFWVGSDHLHVGQDLVSVAPDGAFPASLQTLVVPEATAAVAELRDPRRAPSTLTGSGAPNWTVLDDRMDYVVDLFRSRHLDPQVFAAPYPEDVGRSFG